MGGVWGCVCQCVKPLVHAFCVVHAFLTPSFTFQTPCLPYAFPTLLHAFGTLFLPYAFPTLLHAFHTQLFIFHISINVYEMHEVMWEMRKVGMVSG